MPTSNYADAVRETIAAEMRAQSRMIYFDAGGASDSELLATLAQQVGADRIRSGDSTPLSALLGAAAGAAQMGSPVLVQGGMALLRALTPEFLAASGSIRAPLVIRVLYDGSEGGRRGSALPVALPENGVLAAPSTPADAAGLLRSALKQNQPALFIESSALATLRGSVPARVAMAPGSGAIRREGRDVTLVTAGPLTGEIVAAVEPLANAPSPLQVEVVDLRTLQPLDTEIVAKSLQKTGRLLLCPQSPLLGGFLGVLQRAIQERAFDELDAPIRTFDGVSERADGWREALAKALHALTTE
ncbi:MAG TPA: transketolase C-terminal domain-containing protein [Planctomycetota bacterium]|nr:transketolase C-terminal domain-containing protein [Planctomycetota bacterium]